MNRIRSSMTILYIVIGVLVIGFVLNKIKSHGINQCDVEEAQAIIKQQDALLLDVRTRGEFQAGHLKGAILIPVSELQARMSELALWKDKPVLVYCHSGNRSLTASKILIGNGLKNVTSLRGGIAAWINKGSAIVNGK
jgi:rhodanese-related sulfurtransferase